jgi:hypothetical protein
MKHLLVLLLPSSSNPSVGVPAARAEREERREVLITFVRNAVGKWSPQTHQSMDVVVRSQLRLSAHVGLVFKKET